MQAFTLSAAISLALVSLAGAQTLTPTVNPVMPGVPTDLVVNNTGTTAIYWVGGTNLYMISRDGDLVQPDYRFGGDVVLTILPGQTQNISYAAPAAGPGSSGSYVIYFPYGPGLVTRLDVGTASPGFPAIHAFPDRLIDGFTSHAISFPPGANPEWLFANTSANPHTFGPGDEIRICVPGGTLPLATQPLAGVTVPAGMTTPVFLPLAGLAAGPYTVETTWLDPLAGTQVRRIGIRDPTGADIHLPGGRTVPLGGTLPVRLGFDGVAPGQPSNPVYAFLVGVQPGTLTLPGGDVLPLAPDPLVLESLTSSLFGLLTNNIGSPSMIIPCGLCPPHWGTFLATNLSIAHPHPALSGMTFRIGAVVHESTTGLWGTSQPEEIVLQ